MKLNNVQSDDQSNRLFQGKLNTSAIQKENAKQNQKTGKSFFAGDMNLAKDPIAQRREQAQKEAMKLVKDTFNRDLETEQGLEDGKNDAVQLRAEAKEAGEEIAQIEQMKKEMKEISDPEEYKEMEAQYDEMQTILKGRQNRALNGANQINKSVAGMEIELLKSNPMLEAQNAADKIEESANGEILAMLKGEVIDNIDKKQEEAEEKQEKIKEEKEKEEELTQTKENTEEIVPEQVQDIPKANDDLQKKLDEILEKQKLLKSDLVGITVDQQI